MLVLFALSWPGPGVSIAADAQTSAAPLVVEPAADAVLKRFGEGVQRLRAGRVQILATRTVTAAGTPKSQSATYTLAFARPDRFSLMTAGATPEPLIVSDGKEIFVNIPRERKYLRKNLAVGSFAELEHEFGLGHPAALARLLLADDPRAQLLQGFLSASMVGRENVGDAACDHLRVERETSRWDFWIAAGERPLLLKATADFAKLMARARAERPGAPAVGLAAEFSLSGWEVDAAPADTAFVFRLPEGAEVVSSFRELSRFWEQLSSRPPGKPIPAGADAYTQRNYAEMKARHVRWSYVDSYDRVGRKDPRWDAAARSFLEKTGLRIAGAPGAMPAAQLEPDLRNLLALGCDDPLVLFHCALNLSDMGQKAEAARHYARAVEGFRTVAYPRNVALSAALNLANIYKRSASREERDAAPRLMDQCIAWIGESTRDGTFAMEGSPRRLIEFINRSWDTFKERTADILAAVRSAPGADPWLANMVAAMNAVTVAWEKRGTGFADTVTEAGWQGFREQMKVARTAFTAAYELHPERPEAATGMIGVAMAEQSGAAEERLWFDRAVAAQMDYLTAYSKYSWLLRPRWGGSLADMHAFGVEALETGRFDTDVPFFYLTTLLEISDDLDGARSYWSEPAVYRRLQRMFSGYRAEQTKPAVATGVDTLAVAAAWYGREFLAAGYLLDAMTEKPAPNLAIEYFRTPWEWIVGEVRARTGPLAETVRKAEAAADGRRYREALAAYEGIDGAALADEALGDFVKRRIIDLRMHAQFEAGEWVDLLPDQGLRGWHVVNGSWSRAADGWFNAVGSDKGFDAVCTTDFGSRFEVEADFDPGDSAEKPKWFAYLWVGPGQGIQQYRKWRYYRVTSRNRQPVHFAVQVWDGTGIDRERNAQPTAWTTDEPAYAEAGKFIRIASRDAYPQARLRFRNLRIRRLDAKPELAGAAPR